MSATGQGGVSIIAGQSHGELTPVSIPADGGTLTFTHNVGRKAISVIVTGGVNGEVLSNTDVVVTQPNPNTIVLTNPDEAGNSVFVQCRWEGNTPEHEVVLPGDSRLEIE